MNNSETIKCSNVGQFIQLYLVTIMNLFGIIANGLCIIVFIKMIRGPHTNMSKYLLMKSLSDFFISFINIFQYFYFCSNCKSSTSFIKQLWYGWFYFYIGNIFESTSSIFEIAAIFDCYITITSKLRLIQKNLFFYLFSIAVIIVFSLFHLIVPFGLTIKRNIEIDSNDNKTRTSYSSEFNDFGHSSFYSNFGLVSAIMRDYIFWILLLILNIMVLFLLKRTTQRRRALEDGNNANNNLSAKAHHAEKKKMIMIIAIGCNYLIGHLPYFIWLTLFFYIYKNINDCSFIYVYFLYYLSYVTGIFFYFFFNNVFRKLLIELVPFIVRNSS
jgi:hypothetical protein